MRDKRKLTEALVVQLDPELGITIDNAINQWWHNLRAGGGLRLTNIGYKAFTQLLKIKHYEYAIDDPLLFTQHTILDLDRKMQMPYYIHAVKGIPKKIIFFGSQEAVMVNLFGDLNRFLDNYKL